MKNWQLMRNGQMDREIFVKRAQILDLLRLWFRQEGFLEVETPLMVKHPGMEPHLDLFASEYLGKDGKVLDRRFLHTSPEYAMKKLLGAGFERIFQLTKVFRNGECGGAHNPEFTMLEWYRTNSDYLGMMDDTETMIRFIAAEIGIELADEWKRLSVKEAFVEMADVDLDACREESQLRAVVESKGYVLKAEYDWDDLFFLIMLNEVEPKLKELGPVFLYDYPGSQAALAKKKADDPFWAERFELYIDGVELCNAFSELVDPIEQRDRLEEEQALRRKLGKEAYEIDEDFLEALETMPPSGGNALGIDRLVMVLLEKSSIREVLLFPWE